MRMTNDELQAQFEANIGPVDDLRLSWLGYQAGYAQAQEEVSQWKEHWQIANASATHHAEECVKLLAELAALRAAQQEPVTLCRDVVVKHGDGDSALQTLLRQGTPIFLAQPLPAVPDGWQLVPKEPTEEMLISGQEAITTCFRTHDAIEDCTHSKAAWTAMLAAAPKEKS